MHKVNKQAEHKGFPITAIRKGMWEREPRSQLFIPILWSKVESDNYGNELQAWLVLHLGLIVLSI